MKKIFDTLGGWLAKGAVWCLGHPDKVVAVIQAVKDAKK